MALMKVRSLREIHLYAVLSVLFYLLIDSDHASGELHFLTFGLVYALLSLELWSKIGVRLLSSTQSIRPLGMLLVVVVKFSSFGLLLLFCAHGTSGEVFMLALGILSILPALIVWVGLTIVLRGGVFDLREAL
jgi:hypothetical protein